ncbi:MAG: glycosyltransferase [Kiritimatiellae bacterium]|nr:glycosyltransferase [Kiritimatiellia bacterium]
MNEIGQWIQLGFDAVLMTTFVLSTLYYALTLGALALRRGRRRALSAPSAPLPSVTVQIPTYNELAALRCAERCLAFDYPEDRLQILIGDDSNRPEISAQLDAFADRHPRVEICRRGNNSGFKPGNLNHMLQRTSGDYILVLDSDFLPERDFLAALVQPVLRDPTLAGVQAAWRITNLHQSLTTRMGAAIIHIIHIVILPFIHRFAHTAVFCGSAELIRTDRLVEQGGWTPGAFTEDVDFSLRLISRGERIAYLEDVPCDCEVPYTPRDLFRQQMRWAYGVIRAFLAHGRGLLSSRMARTRTKLAALCFGSGYLMVSCFILTVLLGLLHTAWVWSAEGGSPALAGSVPHGVAQFLLTCGILVSSLCASFVAGAGYRNVAKLAVASLTIGLILVYFVGQGMFKALFGLPMHWFMVRKNGNALASA